MEPISSHFMIFMPFPPSEIITGWWYIYPSEKYEFVNWDDELPN